MDTLTPSSEVDAPLGRPPALSRAEVALLAVSPVVLALGRVLVVPFDDQDWDHMLGDMATHSARNAIGWSLTLVAAALLVPAGLALVRLVPGRARLTVPAGLGIAFGWVGTAAVASGGLVMGNMADSPDRGAMVAVLTRFNEGSGNTIFLLVLIGVIGNVMLAIALARSRVASRGAAVLLGVGAVLSLVGAPGPLKLIAVSGAVLLLGAHLLLLRPLSQPIQESESS